MATEAALIDFENAATSHAEANETGDYKNANKSYKIIARSVEALKMNNQLLMLGKFLDHPSVGVQIWSARYLLPIEEQKAIAVLNNLSSNPGIHALIAETTLSEWRKGNL